MKLGFEPTKPAKMVKFFSKEYCDNNFYLAEGYYYLSEEESDRNYNEPVHEYLHEELCGEVREIQYGKLYSLQDFIEKILTPENDPEHFI